MSPHNSQNSREGGNLIFVTPIPAKAGISFFNHPIPPQAENPQPPSKYFLNSSSSLPPPRHMHHQNPPLPRIPNQNRTLQPLINQTLISQIDVCTVVINQYH